MKIMACVGLHETDALGVPQGKAGLSETNDGNVAENEDALNERLYTGSLVNPSPRPCGSLRQPMNTKRELVLPLMPMPFRRTY